jgi:hypothetical protein
LSNCSKAPDASSFITFAMKVKDDENYCYAFSSRE